MQRDTDLTIGDIVTSLQHWDLPHFGFQHIPRETYSNLRFLEIPRIGNGAALCPTVICELAAKSAHPAEVNYVAVSYCWQSNETANLAQPVRSPPDPTPVVQVRDNGVVREPKCPPQVLLKAVLFALSRDVSLIWIDQECVDQSDDADVQAHLQCNHVIYNQAKFKLGLLTFEITNQDQLGRLDDLLTFHLVTESWVFAIFPINMILHTTRFLTRLLRAISRDRWFTRGWVYQERFSANVDMTLLIPLAFQPSSPGSLGLDFVGNNVALSVLEICSSATLLRKHLSDPAVLQHFEQNSVRPEVVHDLLEALHDAAQSVSGPVLSGHSLEVVWSTTPFTTGPRQEIDRIRNPVASTVFSELEKCDCAVFADKITIFSNIMRFEVTFPVKTFKSYSFALIFLLVANKRFPTVLIQQDVQSSPWIFSRSVSGMDLVVLTLNLKTRVSQGRGSEVELRNIAGELEKAFGLDITTFDSGREAVSALKQHLSADGVLPDDYLSTLNIEGLRSVSIVPMFATIGDILDGTIPWHHLDSSGLDDTHGNAVVQHGRDTNQLRDGARFVAFDGDYCWRTPFASRFQS